MRSCIIGLGAIAALYLSVGGAVAQPAPDCSQPVTPIEKASCGNAEIIAADKAMAQAYSALEKTLPSEERTVLRDDQGDWLNRRGGQCATKPEAELVPCLLAEADRRRRFFTGDGPNNATGAPVLPPRFHAEAVKGRYQLRVVYPGVSRVAGPVEAAFEKAVRSLAAIMDQVRDADPLTDGRINEGKIGYEITYLDARLAAIVFTNWSDTGAAHGYGGRSSLLFDLVHGRALTLPDILAEPDRALPKIAAWCKEALTARAPRQGGLSFQIADILLVVRGVGSWAPDQTGVDIIFDPYSIASYAEGSRECRLSYAELAQWLNPGGPLPPH